MSHNNCICLQGGRPGFVHNGQTAERRGRAFVAPLGSARADVERPSLACTDAVPDCSPDKSANHARLMDVHVQADRRTDVDLLSPLLFKECHFRLTIMPYLVEAEYDPDVADRDSTFPDCQA